MSIEGLELELIVDLVESMAVVIVVAYLFTRTPLYRQVLDQKLGRQGRLLLVLIFGAFSVWGTLSGVDINGAIANTRDLGPALGGLIGGPVVGIGAGLIGGIQRLSMGGYTALPSALGTVAAGVAGGVVFLLYKRRVAPVWAAMLLAVFTESVLMGLNLLMARPFHDALELVKDVIVPMILVNAAGMGLFVFIVRNEERERLTAAQKERMEGELTVARDIQRSIVPCIFPPFPGAQGVRPARVARAGARGRRRPLRLLPARRRPPLPRHRRRGRQGRAGLAVHGRDDHAAARRRARHERRRRARHGGSRRRSGAGQRAPVPGQRSRDVRDHLLRRVPHQHG